MSYGFAVGDFIAVGTLAWRLYKSTKGAPSSFYDIDKDLLSFHAVIQEAEETIFKSPLSREKEDRLQIIGNGCKQILADLQAVVDKYESLGAKRKTLIWDRMRWGKEDITGIRARLSTNATLLGVFISTSQVSVEQKLDKYLEEFRQGRREGSIISNQSIDSFSADERGLWQSIRGELEDVGIDLAAWESNHDYIKAWFTRAVEVGAFEERVPPETNPIVDIPALSSRSSSSPQLSERNDPGRQEYSDSHRLDGSPSRQPDTIKVSSPVQSVQDIPTALSGQIEAKSSQQMYSSLQYYQQLPKSTPPVHHPTQSHREPPVGTAKMDPSLVPDSLYAGEPRKDITAKASAQDRLRHSIHASRQETADGSCHIDPKMPEEDLQPTSQNQGYAIASTRNTPSRNMPLRGNTKAPNFLDGTNLKPFLKCNLWTQSNPYPFRTLGPDLKSDYSPKPHRLICPDTVCGYVGVGYSDLECHMQTHSELKTYPCKYSWCRRNEFPFLRADRLIEHLRTAHEEDDFKKVMVEKE